MKARNPLSDEASRSILMVTREYREDRLYGLGQSLAPLVQELQKRGIDAQYFCQENIPQRHLERREIFLRRIHSWMRRFGGVSFGPLLFALGERIDVGFQAARIARQESIMIIHCHDPWLLMGVLWGRQRWGLKDIQLWVTEHGFGSYAAATQADGLIQSPHVHRALSRLEAWLLAKCDRVIAPTKAGLEALQRDLKLASRPVHWEVIPHARPHWNAIPRAVARQYVGWDQDHIYLIAVGRIVPLKQFPLLVEVFLKLAYHYPALHLCILGEGDETGLRVLADECGLGDRLIIKKVTDVSVYLYAADIYVSVSETESFGLANLEAMSAGLPCVCSKVGGVSEVMGDGAYLFDVTPQDLRALLESWVGSSKTRTLWAEKARQRALNWPMLKNITDRYVQ